MGCTLIICFLCGNTCYGMNTEYIKHFTQIINEYESFIQKKIKKFKGNFTLELAEKYYNYYKKNKNYENIMENFINDTKWLEECTFLTAHNKIIKKCEEVECNTSFKSNNGDYFQHSTERVPYLSKYINGKYYYPPHGLFVHTNCWMFIKNKYGIELKYSDLPILNVNPAEINIFDFVKYKDIQKYWEQEFDYLQLLCDNNEYLCYNPLMNINTNIINTIFSHLKIRKNRPSPLSSASFYDEGMIKIGNDNKFYIIKNKKWMKINDVIVSFESNINLNDKYFESLKCSGEASTIPIFIESINFADNSFSVVKVKILTVNHLLEKVKKKITDTTI